MFAVLTIGFVFSYDLFYFIFLLSNIIHALTNVGSWCLSHFLFLLSNTFIHPFFLLLFYFNFLPVPPCIFYRLSRFFPYSMFSPPFFKSLLRVSLHYFSQYLFYFIFVIFVQPLQILFSFWSLVILGERWAHLAYIVERVWRRWAPLPPWIMDSLT